MTTEELEYLQAMAGTVAFAVTAVLAVTPRGIDLFGACVMGLITAIGGGTIRDLILDVPMFWATNTDYIWAALLASLVAFFANHLLTRKEIHELLLYIDGLGVSMFAIQASKKVMDANFALPLGPVILGVITAIGGGLLRDVLAGTPTLLLRRELYAVPVTIGCTLYVFLLGYFPELAVPLGFLCMAAIFTMRAAAIYWNLELPSWMKTRSKLD